ncbi:MAG: DUF1499 domain-containing protein [Roseobacter sp.]
MIFSLILFIAVLGVLYVKLSPLNTDQWHVNVEASADQNFPSGAVRIIKGDAHRFGNLNSALQALPRTTLLGGSVPTGHVTYVTRSALIGFPDLTTIQQSGDQIKLMARLRFGLSDLGVNRKRLEGLIATLQ